MRTILFIVLSTLIAQILKAQQDTLILKLDDYGQISIMTDKLFSKKDKTLNFDDVYSNFYADFQKIDKSDIQDNTFNIRYIYDKYDTLIRSIEIEKNKNKSKFFYFQDTVQQSVKSFNYVLSVKISKYPYYYMQLSVNKLNDFSKIAKISIDSLYIEAHLDLLNRNLRKRIAYKAIYKKENNKLKLNSAILKPNKTFDYINLYPSFGLSTINSSFVPEIDFNIDFALYHKSKIKYRFGINTSFLFIQDENDFFKVYTYNIANLYYHLFMRDNTSHSFSIGYMYRKTGPHFNGDTYTASWQYNMKHIGVKLGAYYTKNEEGNYVVIPSIGLHFGF